MYLNICQEVIFSSPGQKVFWFDEYETCSWNFYDHKA